MPTCCDSYTRNAEVQRSFQRVVVHTTYLLYSSATFGRYVQILTFTSLFGTSSHNSTKKQCEKIISINHYVILLSLIHVAWCNLTHKPDLQNNQNMQLLTCTHISLSHSHCYVCYLRLCYLSFHDHPVAYLHDKLMIIIKNQF